MNKKLKLFKFIVNIITFSLLSLSVLAHFEIFKIKKPIQILNSQPVI
ncbi:hypothetical protein [Mesomycoplasma ovipneumoniae]